MFFQFSLNALSINIDGYHDGVEWDGATVTPLFSGESNSKVNFGLVKTMINANESAVYLCFMFIDSELEQDNSNIGVSVTVEDSASFEVTAADSPCHSDDSEFSFDGAISIDDNNGATSEIRVGFKHGLPDKISSKVRFIDSDGALSNVYSFTIINDYYSETTELIISESVEATEEPDEEATQAIKTTKIKTTKIKTTKKKTTTEKEERTTDYTLKPRTTVTEKKKTEFHIQTSPPYSYVRKTKAPKLKKTTQAVKTTGKSKTTKAKPATVYYYEKEIIISHVYVSETETTIALTSTAANSEAINSTVNETVASVSTVEEINNPFALSKGAKYKTIIGIFAAVSFTVIAAAATRSAKKSTDNDENTPDSQ